MTARTIKHEAAAAFGPSVVSPEDRESEPLAASVPAPAPDADRSPDLTALGRYGWASGVAGTLVVIGMAYVASQRSALEHGWNLYPSATPPSPALATAFVLLVCAAVMFVIESLVRVQVSGGKVLSIAGDLRARHYRAFLAQCVVVYLVELGLLSAILSLYKIVNEYGYAAKNAYYQPWFTIMPYVLWTYVIGGLPYVILTRALQADPSSDRKQAAFTVMKALTAIAFRLRLRGSAPQPFDKYDRTAVLGVFVKAFFVPLMTVFFFDQFPHLVHNWAFVLDTVLAGKGKAVAVLDVWNISQSLIFSVDVGLAWAGYVVSSRWIKNTLFSVEPTWLGWSVALACYPPFSTNVGYFFSTPGESAFLSLDKPAIVDLLAACSIASFVVYTASTACFGLRFSNLTHRGIITTGPYAIVRHPAYASKNFSWWCVMFPFALNRWFHGETSALYQIFGLVLMSGIYAARALTEERHLEKDPEYRLYAQRVRYRFVPGVI